MPHPAMVEEGKPANHQFTRWVKENSISKRMYGFRFFTEGNEVNEGASLGGLALLL